MADECTVVIESGPVEQVECGEDVLFRLPLVCGGVEIGDIIIALEDLE